MSTPDKKDALLSFVLFLLIAAEPLVRWSSSRIPSLAWHMVLLSGEGNVYTFTQLQFHQRGGRESCLCIVVEQ